MAAVAAEPKALRRKEVAEILGVHPNTVGSWAERGFIKSMRYPNETRYDAESVEALRRQIFGEG
ncbi:MAG TPA: helix-turn-helix domain-containing protein [Gaiellaceae bacterium]|jgi:DNA-binding transcriptional MerR regulator